MLIVGLWATVLNHSTGVGVSPVSLGGLVQQRAEVFGNGSSKKGEAILAKIQRAKEALANVN